MNEITTISQLEKTFKEQTAMLFKHSTTCPISARAYKELQDYSMQHKDASIFIVKVIESRQISNAIVEKTGIKHESPQIFILHCGKAVWNDSHFGITKKILEEKMTEYKKLIHPDIFTSNNSEQ